MSVPAARFDKGSLKSSAYKFLFDRSFTLGWLQEGN